MNKVQQKIYDQVVRPAIDNIAGLTTGIIEEFDNAMQLARVSFSNQTNGAKSYADYVPVMNLGGAKQPNPFPGDTVLLAFLGSNHKRPVILGRIDRNHLFDTRNQAESHFRSGGNITDSYGERGGEFWNAR